MKRVVVPQEVKMHETISFCSHYSKSTAVPYNVQLYCYHTEHREGHCIREGKTTQGNDIFLVKFS